MVATSSLELGIDMGAVDLVIQIESPPSVASALQRVGRAGHQVGEVSRGVLFPKHRGDLAQTAVAVERMRAGLIESMRIPTNPLDVLAQQIVSMVAMEAWSVDDLLDLARRSASYTQLPRRRLRRDARPAERALPERRVRRAAAAHRLGPRHRAAHRPPGRPAARRHQRRHHPRPRAVRGVPRRAARAADRGRRVGELDEEMVYESRVGDVFALGATSWRIEDITHDRVLVTPAPGIPGRLPFWKGDALGRPAELGEAIGAFTRELGSSPRERAATPPPRSAGSTPAPRPTSSATSTSRSRPPASCPATAPSWSRGSATSSATGGWSSTPRTARRCTRPWALAINARLRERYGVDGQAIASDDGIVIRIPDTDAEPPTGEVIAFEPDEIDDLVTQEVGGSALFASRFRECAARALLLPRRDPGRRSPLWQQRQRSAALLEVAASTRRSRSCSRRSASACRTSTTCPPWSA